MPDDETRPAEASEPDQVDPALVDAQTALPTAIPGERIELADIQWKRVSPKYVVAGVVSLVITTLVVAAIGLFLWLVADWAWVAWALPVVIAGFVVAIIVEPRRARSIGYALRADDLVFRRGIMFQRFVSVPFGRMQLVDVSRGPISRWLGLSDLRFVTAAAATGVAIPGLPEAEADELRDRLVDLAESRRAGL